MEIEECTNAYHEGNPIMTDAEFDAMVRKLESVDPEHPALNYLGKKPNVEMQVKHDYPILSLQKAWNIKELKEWSDKIESHIGEKLDYYIAPKYDGVCAVCKYENGKLISVATRGDGVYGVDITDKAVKCGVQEKLNAYSGTITGEIIANKYLGKSASATVAGMLHKSLNNIYSDFSFMLHFENAFNGYCVFEGWDLIGESKHMFNGLQIGNYGRMPCDGVVISVIGHEIQQNLGETKHHPRWAIALKGL